MASPRCVAPRILLHHTPSRRRQKRHHGFPTRETPEEATSLPVRSARTRCDLADKLSWLNNGRPKGIFPPEPAAATAANLCSMVVALIRKGSTAANLCLVVVDFTGKKDSVYLAVGGRTGWCRRRGGVTACEAACEVACEARVPPSRIFQPRLQRPPD